MLSVTKLFKLLHEKGLCEKPVTITEAKCAQFPKNWSDETYGTKSMLYFSAEKGNVSFQSILRLLRDSGCQPNLDWNRSDSRDCFEVQVSYFKGYHWDQ